MRPEYRGSKHPITIGNIRCLTPDVAVADGKWELRGVSDAGGKPLPAFEGQFTLVMKRTGSWFIEGVPLHAETDTGADADMVEASRVPWTFMTRVPIVGGLLRSAIG